MYCSATHSRESGRSIETQSPRFTLSLVVPRPLTRGWEALRRHEVDVNVLCPVHAASVERPLEVYRFLRDEMQAEFMQFIPTVERTTPGCHFQSDQPAVRVSDEANRRLHLLDEGCKIMFGERSQSFPYKFRTAKKKGPGVSAKSLICRTKLVGAIGLEPTTPTMSRWCSNQLSYAPEFAFEGGIVAG